MVAALGLWLWDKNTFSKADLKFEIIAPRQVIAGEEITYIVQWKNNGQVSLEDVVLVFEYPKGSLPSEGTGIRNTISLQEIYPGQEQTRQFKGRLFGKEGDLKEAKAFLSYTPKNISATYESETKGTTLIAFVPLTFELDIPSRIESSQQMNFALNYFSNSEYPLSDLRIKLEYPGGFVFKQATPNPLGDNEWKLGVLNKAEGGRITVRGSLEGQLQEAKVFKATIGRWRDGEFTLLKESTRGIEITKPQIQITQLINGNTPAFVAPGQMLHYEVFFKNVSDKNLENLFLILALEGAAYDFSTLRADRGTFQQGDNSVVWEAKDIPKLRFLGRGETGMVEFWIGVKSDIQSIEKNLVLKDKVLLSEAKEEFEVKVSSRLVVEQKGYFQDEVFGNEGPLPPQVDNRTTYTIIWQAKNALSDVRNAKVIAQLPGNVELTGKIFPENSHLTFDSQSREVVWALGDLLAGTGYTTEPLSVAFQIVLTPSPFQRGSPAQLVGQATITGEDMWTNQLLTGTGSPLDTSIPNDPSAINKGIVQ